MSSNGTASTLLSSFVAAPSSPPPAPSPAPSVTPPADTPAPPTPSPAPPSNPPSSAEPPSSQAPPPATPTPAPSSNPPPPPSSAPPPASSAPPPAPSSAPPPASSIPPAVTTSVATASSAPPSSTAVQTSVITITPSATRAGETPPVVVVTSYLTPSNQPTQGANNGASPSSSPSSTNPAELQGAQGESSSGLSTGGKTAVAVVVPVVVVALLVLGALFFWRKRKQRKNNEDERRKEVEEYGYNPNHDPTLPAVGMHSEMAEDSSGYRGWGNTATSSNRKASTTLTSGMTYSDSASNPGGYQSPNSPTHAYSDANSNDPLVNGRRETLDADGIAALGAVPTSTNNQPGVARGPSNASSSYSAANRSDNSGEYPGMSMNNPPEYHEQGYAGYQEGPYGGNHAYSGDGGQPVIRDVSARRNTRIEIPSVFPQGNSGVATNF